MPRIPDTYQCGKCLEVRQEGNHWWMLLVNDEKITLREFNHDNYVEWEKAHTGNKEGQYTAQPDVYCSEGCLFESIRDWMKKVRSIINDKG